MARRSSFSRSSGSSNRSSASTAAPRPAQSKPSAPAQSQAQPGFLSSMMGTMASGLAFGAGSEVAHQAVRGLMGSNSHSNNAVDANQTQAVPQQNQNQNCQMQNSNFVECLKFNSNNIQNCQDYLTELKSCESRM